MLPEVEAFLEMQVAECGAAQNTVTAYQHDLEALCDFLQQKGIHPIHAKQQDLRETPGSIALGKKMISKKSLPCLLK